MSFPREEDGTFAKACWPKPLQERTFLVDGTEEPKCWQLVPVSFEDMCDWAYVSTNQISPDQTRRHLVLYRDLDMMEGSVVYPVTFRVQGFIERAKLTALGDWDGNSTSAMSAMQYLTLSSGGHPRPWRVFQTAIRHVRQLVHNSIGGPRHFVEGVQKANEVMHLQRRVFTKVNEGVQAPANVLTVVDDPENKCEVLGGRWVVAEKLQIGRLMDNGDTVECSPLALSEGDFVDVGLSFDVALVKAPNGQRRVRVFLCLEHVLQLLPYRQLAKVLPGRQVSTPAHDKPLHGRAPAQIQRSGLSFRRDIHAVPLVEDEGDEIMM